MTYRNDTNEPIVVSWCAHVDDPECLDNPFKSVVVAPGALLSFDETADNGDEIIAACNALVVQSVQ